MSLPDHLERFLGPIEAGWGKDADGVAQPFQIIRFTPPSLPGCVVFSTLGLSRISLHSRSSGIHVRHEFMMILPESFRNAPIPGLLQKVGGMVSRSGEALLRGDTVGPEGPLWAQTQMEALYASTPVYLPDAFAEYDGVVMVWLVPMSHSEFHYVHTQGWEAFEDRLMEQQPDLIDTGRSPLLLP